MQSEIMVSSNLSTPTRTETATVIMQLSIFHMVAFLLVTKQQCLLLSGDVELNPGPLDQGTVHSVADHTDSMCSFTYFIRSKMPIP